MEIGMPEESELDFGKQSGQLWRPIFTLARNEKKVYSSLRRKGIAAYLPMCTRINVQPVSSKGKNYCYKRKLTVPMFSNYLFARLSYDQCVELLQDRSVLRILPITPLDEDGLIRELQIIRSVELFSRDEEIDISNGIVKGTRVKFTDGRFIGWEGIALETPRKDGFVYINITSIDASIKLKYPAIWCRNVEDD